ncbi:MAG: 3-phosphoserine/phosphohydroxythreonine transaminase [Clostridia bacterium]|nr:3-phosphoserine/phosphohydroxythreonine transaminase [Clostridia bacterium]
MRVYNFSAGPSMLPEEVLKKAAEDMLDYEGSGMSVLEMSHRAKCYDAIIKEAEALIRELMNIPENYKVLFVQGGASTQFAAVALNLHKNGKADYVASGNFSSLSAKEGARLTNARVIASSEDATYTYVPKITKDMVDPEADYLHICFNNTIFGTKYNYIPETPENVPLVADMSSMILSEPVDVTKFGVIYAGAQKNIGPAGVTVVIVREDLLDKFEASCPTMLKWKTQADKDSLYNTPPCYSIYISMLVFRWIKAQGGVDAIYAKNVKKATMLYDYIDSSDFYKNSVNKEDRSLMNVPFVTPSEELDAKFVKEAAAAGLVSLKGHRLVGGMRASIYNAMPIEGIEALIAFMKKFEAENK